MQFIMLNDGVTMPQLGFGTYQIAPAQTERCVTEALRCGYRSIDTAQNYGNEEGVGTAISKSGVAREELFITTKTQTNGYKQTKRGIDGSLAALGLDYVDLLLIHWPSGNVVETYRALEDALAEGKARAIGLSNFYGRDLEAILSECSVKPAVDQIECHVFWQQQLMRDVLGKVDIRLMDWSPLACGLNGFFQDPTLRAIGDVYGKTAAQVALRFLIQQGDIVVVKSEHRRRMEENIDIFDFELTDGDMDTLRELDEGHGLFGWPAGARVAQY